MKTALENVKYGAERENEMAIHLDLKHSKWNAAEEGLKEALSSICFIGKDPAMLYF